MHLRKWHRSSFMGSLTAAGTLIAILSAGQSYIPGYEKAVHGEVLHYHAPQPDADTSLLIRSEDERRYIEWETAPAPPGTSEDTLHFLMLAGIDVNREDPHSWKVFVNGRHTFTLSSPQDTLVKNLAWTSPDGCRLEFNASEVDRYGDLMGYLVLEIPPGLAAAGEPVRIRVSGETAGSRTWFMVFNYSCTGRVTLEAQQAVRQGPDGNYQLLKAEMVHYGPPASTRVTIGSNELEFPLRFGYNAIYIPFPEINNDTSVRLSMTVGERLVAERDFALQPVAKKTIYLLHHSHNDIGYTHVQDEVERMQWKNLRDAARLAGETRDLPDGSRFKWNTEVMWAVDSFLDSASHDDREAFTRAVRAGSIELNGLYANELTGLCSQEELFRLTAAGRRISRECGVELTSAMISDIPGWTWSLVPVMAQSGIRYFSLGTNQGHRIGNTLKVWGDRPFYWVSPSGKEKVLAWIHETGYSLFHTGLDYSKIEKRLREDLVFGYINRLVDRGYPYDIVMLRYNIGSDNGPVDELLAQAVAEWNKAYATPKMVISTVTEAFSIFEERYGAELPKVRGDFTGFWEDGAASTARETALNRRTASLLSEASALWTMLDPHAYPSGEFEAAWKNVLLFDEHTWGSWNSVSEPESPFTQRQWEIKRSFALEAHERCSQLLAEVLARRAAVTEISAVEVINTSSWERSDIVIIPVAWNPGAPRITSQSGEAVVSQRLTDGSVAFLATGIPPLGSRIFVVNRGTSGEEEAGPGEATGLEDENFRLELDTASGAIARLFWKGENIELVRPGQASGLNELVRVEGRDPSYQSTGRMLEAHTADQGPLVRSLRIRAEAPGCANLESEIRLISPLRRIEIINRIDKRRNYDPEGHHLAFPFNIPDPVLRYDLAFGMCRTDADQVSGSNRNFQAIDGWADISNEDYGITLTSPDAPLIEAGVIMNDPVEYGWVEKIGPAGTVYSYIMNNYWETNYHAGQEGKADFRYTLFPHGPFDPVDAEKRGVEQRQPLVILPATAERKPLRSVTGVLDERLTVFAIRPGNYKNSILVGVYNPSDETAAFKKPPGTRTMYFCDPDGNRISSCSGDVEFEPHAVIFIDLDRGN